MPVHPRDELLELAHRSIPGFQDLFLKLGRAIFSGSGIEGAEDRLATSVADTMILADLIGRRRVFIETDNAVANAPPEAIFAKAYVVPKVSFTEAFTDILTREPRLAVNAEEVAALYRETHSFAVARSASDALTARIQAATTKLIESGAAPRAAAVTLKEISAEIGNWTKSYSETVYRTNLNTAYTAGRFEQAADPDIAAVMPALERFSMGDVDVRAGRKEDGGENHQAASGLVAATNDPIWTTHSPPSGYRCRCQVRLISVTELRRRNLLDESGRVLRREPKNFADFRPHPNFARKPSDVIYGGGAIV